MGAFMALGFSATGWLAIFHIADLNSATIIWLFAMGIIFGRSYLYLNDDEPENMATVRKFRRLFRLEDDDEEEFMVFLALVLAYIGVVFGPFLL